MHVVEPTGADDGLELGWLVGKTLGDGVTGLAVPGAKVGAGASLLTSGTSLSVPAGTLLETTLRMPLQINSN